jgi:DNA-binding MarR family transcriptional regulator
MIAQLRLHDNDLVLWSQLLAERLNAETLEALGRDHPDLRYAHGFLIQQLVDGARPVGEIAANLGVTSQAVSKSVKELEALGYVGRAPHPDDARVRQIALTDKGQAAIQATRDVRATLNEELETALGGEAFAAAARTLRAALDSRGGMPAVAGRRVRPAQGLSSARR